MHTPLPESCRLVQGSKQAFVCITSEQRTEISVGCADLRPIQRIRVPVKAGTRVVPQRLHCAFVS